MIEKEKLGKMISLQRKARGMTQRQLSEALHVSFQAVSKWEAGKSMPSLEMMYDIANTLNVTVDSLLNDNILSNRDICYKDVGLDTNKLYSLKDHLQELVTEDKQLLSASYIGPVLYQIDTKGMKEPVYSMMSHIPGSKAKFARTRGYDKEICMDLAAKAINDLARHAIKPQVFKAHLVCGNKDEEQIWSMAKAFKKICEENDVIYTGLEISAQPVNYLPGEYELSSSITGVVDREQIMTGKEIKEGDVIIGMLSEGLDSVCFPFVHVMLERNPGLAYEKIDATHFFMDEILKPCKCFGKPLSILREQGILHGAIRYGNSILDPYYYQMIGEGLGAKINLSAVPVKPLYAFMANLELLGRRFFPERFAMGIGMSVVVPHKEYKKAMKLIAPYAECFVLGQVEKDTKHVGEKIWTEGEISW